MRGVDGWEGELACLEGLSMRCQRSAFKGCNSMDLLEVGPGKCDREV